MSSYEFFKFLPLLKKSVASLDDPEVNMWEIGFLMRTMQYLRSASFKLGLSEISHKANDLEWLAMRMRVDPSLLGTAAVQQFEVGLMELKTMFQVSSNSSSRKVV